VVSQLESLHKCRLIKEFLDEYVDLHIPYRYPIDTRAPVYKEQEQEQEQEQNTISNEIECDSIESPHLPQRMATNLLIETWNRVCPPHGLPKKTKITTKLLDQIRRRLVHNPEPDFWIAVIETIPTRPFLLGQNDQGWTATLDWLVKNDENAVKVFEGHYQSNGARASPKPYRGKQQDLTPEEQARLQKRLAEIEAEDPP
jgi:hypothetical protein